MTILLSGVTAGCLQWPTHGLEFAEEAVVKHPGWVGALAFDPANDRFAVGGSDATVRIRSSAGGTEITLLPMHGDFVAAVAFAPDGQTLASGSFDRSARLWDTQTRQLRHTLNGHRGAVMTVAFSPDGSVLATGSIDGALKFWETKSGNLTGTIPAHRSWVNSIAFNPHDGTLVSGSSDGTVKIWDAKRRVLQKTFQPSPAEVRSVAVSNDGRFLCAGIRYGLLSIWLNGRPTFNLKAHDGDVWALAFAPDGRTLFSGDGDWNKPGQVKVWNPETGALLAVLNTSGEVLSLACSRNGARLAAGAWDKTITLWHISD